jgi:hypothetical protein
MTLQSSRCTSLRSKQKVSPKVWLMISLANGAQGEQHDDHFQAGQ